MVESTSPHISYYYVTDGCLKYAWALDSSPIVLTGSPADGQLVLNWTAIEDTAVYWVYGTDNEVYFEPGFAPGYQNWMRSFLQTQRGRALAAFVDPDHNWTYLVIAVDETGSELVRSNRVGEWDLGADIP